MRNNFRLLIAVLLTVILGSTLLALAATASSSTLPAQSNNTQGSLSVLDENGKVVGMCPLKHTAVRAEISGFLSRVVVTQQFENPFPDKIEAVYTFPLPAAAAVDDMTMKVGTRTVRGRILPKAQAQAVYAAARNSGQVASLLDQQRPNIFTQSVANILPGEKVFIEISYLETLKYEAGTYQFVFPMVVGPRYIPGTPTGKQDTGTSPDTTQVPDASRITPPVAAAGTRAGHDISLEVSLDAGVPIDEIKAQTHEIEVDRQSERRARVTLRKQTEIPNKDFVLRYEVAGQKVQDALLTHRAGKGGFFTFILQPPERVTAEDVTPKELVFVIDTSGSMQGFPLEKARETMKLAMDNLYPQDTFNLITFSGDTQILFPQPVAATKENLEKAQKFLEGRESGGGTEMMKAIKAALDPTDSQAHVRIVCFMTDGYVGNDMEIIGEIQKHPNARVFSFGIGSSTNRFLLDKMAEEGRGEVEYVGLNEDGSAAARRFYERVRSPLLTDISIEWAGLAIADVYPKRIPDLFSAKPVILTGRYTGSGKAVIKVKGKMSGREYVREIPVELPEAEGRHEVLATLWARTRIDDLMSKDWQGLQQGAAKAEVEQEITQLGLEYRLMTQYTSFVAVEELTVTEGGVPRKVEVPVEVPEGVNPEQAGSIDNLGLLTNGTFSTVDVSGDAPLIQSTQSQLSVTYTPEGGWGMWSRTKPGSREHKPSKPSKKEQLLQKLHPSIAALIKRLEKKGSKPAPEELKFVNEGKALIQVFLVDKSPEVLTELQKLGFEITLEPQSAKIVIGRITLEKLKALGSLKSVRYVAPQIS